MRDSGRVAGASVVVLPILVATAVGSVGSATAQSPGRMFRDCEACPQMVVVPSGSFLMGWSDYLGEDDPFRDRLLQRSIERGYALPVDIDYELAVGVYEVTFDEWDACVRGGGCGGYEPDDQGWGRGRRPVIRVNWDQAWSYADWLTEMTGKEYRLLSEAEWEYVARAGRETEYDETEVCRYANLNDSVCRDDYPFTAPVGSFRPNGFRLYDVVGNVSEWVDDCDHELKDNPGDGRPSYAGDCSRRRVRGLDSSDIDLGAFGLRYSSRADAKTRFRGFRVARSVR